jgi:hypothetical protein
MKNQVWILLLIITICQIGLAQSKKTIIEASRKKIDSLNILLEKERGQNQFLKEENDYLNQEFIICANSKSQLSLIIDSLQKLNKELKKQNSPSNDKTTNYFGSGGNGRGDGSVNGPFGGRENGVEGYGTGPARGSGKGRVRLNNVSIPKYELDFECRIMFKLQVNADGQVVDVRTIKSVTTCVEDRIINDLKERIKREVRCNKDPGSPIIEMDYTVKLVPGG